MTDDLENLKEAIADNDVVIFIGTGVSHFTTGSTQAVSGWKGLLKHGLDRCLQKEWIDKIDFNYFNKKLNNKEVKVKDYLDVADEIKKCFMEASDKSNNVYKAWLEETVGALSVNQPELIEAIGKLGCPILTTNYDSLLEDTLKNKPPLTWTTLADLKRKKFDDLKNYILHVHGYYKDPESVVFTSEDYQQMLDNEFRQSKLKGMMEAKNWLFIGYGAGMSDPTFSTLLDWRRRVGGEGSLPIYQLVKSHKISDVSSEENIKIIEYGENRENLLEFIQSLKSSTPKSESTLENLIGMVKQAYQQHSRIKCIMDPTKSITVGENYINLAVKAKKQEREEKQGTASRSADTGGRTSDKINDKNTVKPKDIFETCKNKEKRVLVIGEPGIGKSTFCRYVAYQWATGSYWSQYELLALIPLRRLTSNRYPLLPHSPNYSLIDLVKREVFQDTLSENDNKVLKKQFDEIKILWILDGYDEIEQKRELHLENLFEQLLNTPYHILTSRQYLNTSSYDVQMEITRFTDENIEQYMQQFFDEMNDKPDDASIKNPRLLKLLRLKASKKSNSLWDFLRSKPAILDIAQIPVNLEMICSLWSNGDLSKTGELTTTALYSEITDCICRRYLTPPDRQILQLSRDEIQEVCGVELEFLECLAFNAMKSNTTSIQPALVEAAFKETKVSSQDRNLTDILSTGFLNDINQQGIDTKIETDNDYCFVHRSFQEYFAARYLVRDLSKDSNQEAIKCIKYQKYTEYYAQVFIFASGLLSMNVNQKYLKIFWDTIEGEPLDRVGLRHMKLFIWCTEETFVNQKDIPRRKELLEWIAKRIKYILSTKNKINEISLPHLLYSLRRAQSVACHEKIINTFIALLTLNDTDTDTKATVLSFVSELKISNPSSELINSVVTALDDTKNKDIKANACKVLGKMGERAAMNDTVISKLLSAIADEDFDNFDVSWNAAAALENLGKKATNEQVINKLMEALEKDSDHVKRSACRVLGNIGEKAARKDVIGKLMDVLGDKTESDDAKEYACEALGEMSAKAATNEQVINKLMEALENGSKGVKRSACRALGNMGEKAATDEVISKLGKALVGDKFVICSACIALRNMGKKAATEEVISNLFEALKHEDKYVKSFAYGALKKLGGEKKNGEVISKLLSALNDGNVNVKQNVFETLGIIGEKAATNEVIIHLMNALEDKSESDDVKQSACEALGEMGEETVTDEVISKLKDALDESDDVKQSACKALGNMGEKAATDEVISKLKDALDESDDVKQSACEALGKMGEKAATDEVIIKLKDALDDNDDVKRSACEALGNMGKKAATKEVISKLTNIVNDEKWWNYIAVIAVANMLNSSSIIKQLDPEIVSKLCSNKHVLVRLKNSLAEQLMDIFFSTGNSEWLPAVTLLTLREGVAVTFFEEKVGVYGEEVVLYGKEESLKPLPSLKRCQELIRAFTDQEERRHLSPKVSSEARNKSNESSRFCNIL